MLALYGLGYIFAHQNISIKTLLFEHVLPFVLIKEWDTGKIADIPLYVLNLSSLKLRP